MFDKVDPGTNHLNVVIIGGGQAGLATGYFLKKRNKDFIILDENEKIGDSWRKRWDSLRLFTPSQHDSLPGMPFPASRGSFPGKDQMADYLESYAMRFSLPVHSGVKVEHIYDRGGNFEIESFKEKLIADKVVVATGTNPQPYVPVISADISPAIYQIHSSGYRNPETLPAGDVLVVGARKQNGILFKEQTHWFPLASPDNRNKNFFNNPWEVNHKGFPILSFKVIKEEGDCKSSRT